MLASSAASWAISSSIFAQTGTARIPACDSMPLRPTSSTARSAAPMSSSSRLITSSSGLADRNWNPRSVRASSRSSSRERMGEPSSSAARQRARTRASRSRFSPAPFFLSRSIRSIRRSVTSRSARISSSSTACASRAASMPPAACGTSSARNARTTCSSAFASAVGPHVDETARRCGAGKIHERDRGGHLPPRFVQRRQFVEPFIGDRRRADVRLVAPEPSCGAVRAGAGQEVE